jgi:hypothetical protein
MHNEFIPGFGFLLAIKLQQDLFLMQSALIKTPFRRLIR